MSLRHFMNIVEGEGQGFDEKVFFQHLTTLVLEIRQSIKRSQISKEYHSELKPLIKNMFSLIKGGKIKVRNYSKHEYKEFVTRIEAMVAKSGISPQDLPTDSSDDEKTQDLSRQSDSAPPAPAPPPNTKWQVVNLAVRPGKNGKSDPLGVAKQGTIYYIFKGAVGDKYAVTRTPGLSDAQRQFYDDMNQGGYTEVSPGSYNSVRNGTNVVPKSHYTHRIMQKPLADPNDFPPNAKAWR